MSKIILRRDFSDESVIQQFADLVGNVDDLRMLVLVTYADIKAVNNEVLTPWKEDLLWQLYVETYNLLTLGLADDRYEQQPAMEADIPGCAGSPAQEDNGPGCSGLSRWLPPPVLENYAQKRYRRALHAVAETRVGPDGDAPGAERRPHLRSPGDDCRPPFPFFKDHGVLSYFGMNILRGQAFSNRHGTIFRPHHL
jgi:[protein-PII] uridylyltransferase